MTTSAHATTPAEYLAGISYFASVAEIARATGLTRGAALKALNAAAAAGQACKVATYQGVRWANPAAYARWAR